MTKLSKVIVRMRHLSYLAIALVIVLSPATALADASLDPALTQSPESSLTPEATTTDSESAEPTETTPLPTEPITDNTATIEDPPADSPAPDDTPTTSPQPAEAATEDADATTEEANPTIEETALLGEASSDTALTADEPASATDGPAVKSNDDDTQEESKFSPDSPIEQPSSIDTVATNETFIESSTGDISVSDSRFIGDSTTGDALAAANTVNIIQFQSSLSNDGEFLTFVTDIQGDVYGDILIDPAKIESLKPPVDGPRPLDVTVATTQQLDNDIKVAANSGNISLDDARKVGDATTGNSEAVANVVNLLNSAVAAQQSFLGIINIYGNLNGDILLPEGFIDGLIASNTPSTVLSADDIEDETIRSQFKSVQAINNDVTLSATSGSITAQDTARIGDITTGDARTNLTIFNLAGAQVSATNSLLVFVNVLGEWVGFIINSPAGDTTAALGGGLPSSLPATAIKSDASSAINNTISVSANSGDIALNDIRRAGNLRTGDATASANILNIVNSQISLSDWFGILFINVFGVWHGSFGVDTMNGGLSTATVADEPIAPSTDSQTAPEVFRFVPATSQSSASYPRVRNLAASYTYAQVDSEAIQDYPVLAAAIAQDQTTAQETSESPVTGTSTRNTSLLAFLLIGLPLVGYGVYRTGLVSRLFA